MCDTWEVKEDWGVNDHKYILIGVESVEGSSKQR